MREKIEEYEKRPEVVQRRKERDERKVAAVEKIREAGMVVNFQASNIVLDVVCENVEVIYRDGRWALKIDGNDITDQLVGIRITGAMYNFPVITPSLKPKGRTNINTDEKPRIRGR